MLVDYSHPEDHNQAWFPKGVVILGLSLAIDTVLMFPLVRRRQRVAQHLQLVVTVAVAAGRAGARVPLPASRPCGPSVVPPCLVQDVANKAACSSGISPSACSYTLPMYTLWQAAFIANLVMVFAFIPFTLFFYEADSDL